MNTYLKAGIETIDEKSFGDFKWKIKYIGYDPEEGIFNIELLIWENEFKHSRTISFPAPAAAWVDAIKDKVQNAILAKQQFQSSTVATDIQEAPL